MANDPAAGRMINILLVDDEARNLDALEVILADPGYRLMRAQTGEDALRAVLKHDIAAIVLDIRMPDMSGLELAKLIQGYEKYREIPILLLTAYLIEDADVAEGYGAGAVDYLTKPVNPTVLRQKVAAFAKLHRRTLALAELNDTLEARVRERTAELERSEAALREAAQQKDEFLATLAHELRNPLAPLRMGLDLLLRTASPESAGTLAVMNRQLSHMVRLIDDLLDVARITSGKLELKRERVALADCVRTALDTCRPFFEKRQQSVVSRLDAAVFANADATRVAQVVSNLLHNASKFSPASAEIVVELELDPQTDRAAVRVRDRGVGLEPEQLARVFEMFTRIETPSAGSEGLGIGLALAKKLTQMHGGELTVTSPGKGLGSVFSFYLPAEAGASTKASASVRAPALTQAGVSVVVIEDNLDSAEMMALALEQRGYVPSVAHSGLSGLELVRVTRPAIVLCDVGLPEIDGVEVCRRVRALPLGYRPIMIAVTGWGMQEDRRRTEEAGFDHHLLKPVAPEQLFALLDSVAVKSSVAALGTKG